MNYKKSQNTFINKTLAVQILFVVVIAMLVLFLDKFFKIDISSVGNKGEKTAALMIDFENMKRAFEGEIAEKMTVLDALNASVAAGQIKLIYAVDINNNTVVTEINDHIALGDKNFSFYINGGKIDTKDLNKTAINPGDKITVRLE